MDKSWRNLGKSWRERTPPLRPRPPSGRLLLDERATAAVRLAHEAAGVGAEPVVVFVWTRGLGGEADRCALDALRDGTRRGLEPVSLLYR